MVCVVPVVLVSVVLMVVLWWGCGCLVSLSLSVWVPAVGSVFLVVLSVGLVIVRVPGWLVVMVRVSTLCLMVLILVLILGLGHPVGLMMVVCVLVALFCAVRMVCILSVWPQRLPLGAARAECGPSGRIVWKVVMGASGRVSNLE